MFIVGAQRCGSTLLYRLLDSHPDVMMARPVRPEPKVFLADDVVGDPQAYDARLFADVRATPVRGEKATSYLEHPAALDRIGKTFPDAHIVVAVRDPIERAVSNYRFSVDHGHEDRSPDAALLDDLEGRERAWDRARFSVSPYAYVRRGHYLEAIRRVEARFDRTRIHVVVFEELVSDVGEAARIFRALGVAEPPRNGGPPVAVNPSTAPATLSAAVRDRLRDHFAEPNAALARHLGRTLDAWQ
ncbi:MAG TPA: sulfotransferase [Euzebyales bacterium]|nr:sulfotransferase [Euzebyales bacterium]